MNVKAMKEEVSPAVSHAALELIFAIFEFEDGLRSNEFLRASSLDYR